MKHLYFCRHGESQLNKEGLFAGTTETPLTNQGRAQAKLEGERAKGLRIGTIVSSPQSRALETAQIIAREIGYAQDGIMINELFRERDYGELEQTPYTIHIDLTQYPSVESDKALIARAEKAAAWLETLKPETILLVSHGSLGRALRFVYQPETDFEQRIPNARIVKLL